MLASLIQQHKLATKTPHSTRRALLSVRSFIDNGTSHVKGPCSQARSTPGGPPLQSTRPPWPALPAAFVDCSAQAAMAAVAFPNDHSTRSFVEILLRFSTPKCKEQIQTKLYNLKSRSPSLNPPSNFDVAQTLQDGVQKVQSGSTFPELGLDVIGPEHYLYWSRSREQMWSGVGGTLTSRRETAGVSVKGRRSYPVGSPRTVSAPALGRPAAERLGTARVLGYPLRSTSTGLVVTGNGSGGRYARAARGIVRAGPVDHADHADHTDTRAPGPGTAACCLRRWRVTPPLQRVASRGGPPAGAAGAGAAAPSTRRATRTGGFSPTGSRYRAWSSRVSDVLFLAAVEMTAGLRILTRAVALHGHFPTCFGSRGGACRPASSRPGTRGAPDIPEIGGGGERRGFHLDTVGRGGGAGARVPAHPPGHAPQGVRVLALRGPLGQARVVQARPALSPRAKHPKHTKRPPAPAPTPTLRLRVARPAPHLSRHAGQPPAHHHLLRRAQTPLAPHAPRPPRHHTHRVPLPHALDRPRRLRLPFERPPPAAAPI
ncbi:hypothetical protein FIBSPDRAFT_937543 [Athelia psychrophila]|uniref:Uncharacterized protein n=1 Tax=Athelia psychrophila TaxID=1759441 RepID=A0A166ABL0_9AGAM|nr:hypothetical protein FIBSPDRAFT_937543 [Fibularhizoctonia sp. CBS 109695]